MLTEGPTPEEAQRVGEHFAYLQSLTSAGTVLMAGRTVNADEKTFGIVIFVAESEPKAREIVENDPAVKYGIMRAELFSYRIALWAANFPPPQS
jgi:uncharacterized protein